MLEQLNIRKAELNSRIIKDKSNEAEQDIKINDISTRLEAAQKNALEIAKELQLIMMKLLLSRMKMQSLVHSMIRLYRTITERSQDLNLSLILLKDMMVMATVSVK